MKKFFITILIVFFPVSFCSGIERDPQVLTSMEEKEQFARDISDLIGASWQQWQDTISINGIEVEGSNGLLSPGDLGEPVLKKKIILLNFDSKGRSYEYIECMKTVVSALTSGMRTWQRGYRNRRIPFPQGASCTFTLPRCRNLPVSLASGESPGDKVMKEENLYNHMIYHTPFHSEDIYTVYKAAAKGIAKCFVDWKNTCSIVDIYASGGIAPQPGPMGAGAGPVRGAKGNSGKLKGKPFCSDLMYDTMITSYNNK